MIKVLLTGARSPIALHLARLFHRSGHEVFVADSLPFHVCYFSNAIVSSHTYASPRYSPKAFLATLIGIIEENKIDLVIPLFEELIYISKHKEFIPDFCTLYSSSFEQVHALHNKYLFQELLQKHGFPVAQSILIKTKKELKNIKAPYDSVLKLSYTRAAQNLYFIPQGQSLPDVPIDPKNPWVLQKEIKGKRFSTFSICSEGKLLAHACYPVGIAIDGHSCLVFKEVENKQIEAWMEKFVGKTNFTGQIGMDFIFDETNQELYTIDANPRATAGLHLFSEKTKIVDAYLNQLPKGERVYPEKGAKEQITAGMFFYGFKDAIHRKRKKEFIETLFTTPDVVFDNKDLMPFIVQPFLMGYYILKSIKNCSRILEVFTSDQQWNGEEILS